MLIRVKATGEKSRREGQDGVGFSKVDISVSVHNSSSVLSYFTGNVRLQLSASTAPLPSAVGGKTRKRKAKTKNLISQSRNPAGKGGRIHSISLHSISFRVR